MEPITLVIGGVTLVVSAAVAKAIAHYRNKVAVLNGALDKLATSLSQYAKTYTFEECDAPIINKVKSFIDSIKSKGSLALVMESMDENERKAYMRNIAFEIATIMEVELEDVNIGYLGLYELGHSYLNEHEKFLIGLNEAVLIADPDRLLITVCHELRHLQQMQSLTNDKWGFSVSRKAQWMASFESYVSMDEADQLQYVAYVSQSIETDANMFADAVNGIK